MSDSLWPQGLHHASLPCPSLVPGVCSNPCPLSWWCYLTIVSSVTLFSFCLQSFPVSGSFPMSQLFYFSKAVINTYFSFYLQGLNSCLVHSEICWVSILDQFVCNSFKQMRKLRFREVKWFYLYPELGSGWSRARTCLVTLKTIRSLPLQLYVLIANNQYSQL